MDERSIILKAIKTPTLNPQTQSSFDMEFLETDVIAKMVKRKKQQHSYKHKNCLEWSNVDFSRYLDHMLKEFGVARSEENARKNSDRLNYVYDKLAKHLLSKMNNLIFKEYIDWWCSIWAPRLTGSEFSLHLLNQNVQIERFVSRYTNDLANINDEDENSDSFISDDDIYSLGGLGLVVMKSGIVLACRILKKKHITHPYNQIQNVLEKLNKEALTSTMNITIQRSPYPFEDSVDFIDITKTFLKKHGLTEFMGLNYIQYFRSKEKQQ